MKITRAIAKSIRSAITGAAGRRQIEVGHRTWPDQTADADGFNFLLWGSGHDLDGTVQLAELVGTDVLGFSGWIALDCYCYRDGELDCNAYVLLNPAGSVVYCSQDDLRHAAEIDAILELEGLSYKEQT